MLRVKFERTSRQLSQHAVAALSRIPQPAVSAIERGVLTPNLDQLERLGAVFGVAPEDLLTNIVVLGPRR